jgi:hypothetical protein
MKQMKMMKLSKPSVEATVRKKILSYINHLITKPIHIKDFTNDAAPTGSPKRTTLNKENV